MLEWIVSSTLLTAIVIALRAVLKGRISLRLQYALWALVMLRLLVPVSLGATGLSIGNLTQKAAETETARAVSEFAQTELPRMSYSAAYSEVAQEYAEQGIDIAELPAEDFETVDDEIQSRMAGRWSVRDILFAVWVAGIGAVGLMLLGSNVRFAVGLRRSRRRLEGADCPLPVYVSPAVETPCLFGLLRPAVYITPEATANDRALRHIVQHELTHFRHGDHIWSLLRGLCLALHWYNPLVWWAAVLSRSDAELACDEATIRRLGEQERAEYGRTLIGMTCQKRPALLLAATTMTGSKSSIKERIVMIAKKPKTAIYTLVAVLFIAAVAAGCAFTGPKEAVSQPGNTAEQPISIGTEVEGDLPAAVTDYALAYVQAQRDCLKNELGCEITEARIVGLTRINTGTAGLNDGIDMYRLEYRLLPADPDRAARTEGLRLEDGWITEWSGAGQPCLLLHWDNSGAERVWERVCVTGTGTIEQEYGTPEMLERYGNAYTAAAMELYAQAAGEDDGPREDSVEGWAAADVERWQSEVGSTGFTVQADGSGTEIGQQWAEAFAAQFLNTSQDSPLRSTDSAVLRCTLYAESLLSDPKELVFHMGFACRAADAAGFERWYAAWAGPLSDPEYPPEEGWLGMGGLVVLEQTGRGQWTCTGMGSGGYGGWGTLNYWEAGETDFRISSLLAGNEELPENLLRVLPFVDWAAFERDWGAQGWEKLVQMLDDICLTEGQVYGPEATRMWADVYPDDQAYRDLYVMLAALQADGAYARGLADILVKQRNYDPETFERCLQSLTREQSDTIRVLMGAR